MMKKQNVRTLALIVCTFTYLLVGAAIFDAFESKTESKEKEKLEEEEEQLKIQHNLTDTEFAVIRKNIIASKPYKAGTQWKFAGAFYFALSVITTIGYGHSTPKTTGGKLFCIAYALGGIPLNIVMFQSIGERFNIGSAFLLGKLKKTFKLKRHSVSQTELMVLASFLCSTVLFGGAAAFHWFEGWEFLNAFYFCFITMSTIGFGDYVSLQNEETKALQTQPEYVAFSILYILSGLTVFAAALNLMVLRLLTMNTEDERKDELEAQAARRGAVKLEGDVIKSGGNGNTTTNAYLQEEGLRLEAEDDSDDAKAANSWQLGCYNHRPGRKLNQKGNGIIPRYSARRSPGKISHLLPMQPLQNGRSISCGQEEEEIGAVVMVGEDEQNDDTVSLHPEELNSKRCSLCDYDNPSVPASPNIAHCSYTPPVGTDPPEPT